MLVVSKGRHLLQHTTQMRCNWLLAQPVKIGSMPGVSPLVKLQEAEACLMITSPLKRTCPLHDLVILQPKPSIREEISSQHA